MSTGGQTNRQTESQTERFLYTPNSVGRGMKILTQSTNYFYLLIVLRIYLTQQPHEGRCQFHT